MTSLPPAEDIARLTSVLLDDPQWSMFWDKRYAVWRVTEDDPDSDLYVESASADAVIAYMSAHS